MRERVCGWRSACALARRQLRQGLVAREGHQQVQAGVEPVEHAHPARRGLQANVDAAGCAGAGRVAEPARLSRRVHPVHPADRDRAPGGAGHRLELGVVVVEAGLLFVCRAARCAEIAHRLQHAVRQAIEHRGQRVELGARHLERRRHPPLGRAVGLGAADGQPGRAVEQRLAQQGLHLPLVVRAGGFAAGGALAHHVQAQAVVRHQGHEVQAVRHGVQRAAVVGERLPVPAQALGQRRSGDLLDPFHQVDQHRMVGGAHRCESDAAVAHHQRGHAVVDAGHEGLVPRGLTVVVGVQVDEARQHMGAVGVDGPMRRVAELADCNDPAVADAHVGQHRIGARAVDDGARLDQHVQHGVFLCPARPVRARRVGVSTAFHKRVVDGTEQPGRAD